MGLWRLRDVARLLETANEGRSREIHGPTAASPRLPGCVSSNRTIKHNLPPQRQSSANNAVLNVDCGVRTSIRRCVNTYQYPFSDTRKLLHSTIIESSHKLHVARGARSDWTWHPQHPHHPHSTPRRPL